MAYTFLVLVSRGSLPEIAELGSVLRKAKLPLEIKEPWSWKKDSGWLPMTWRKADSGCEVELQKLSKKDAAAAAKAGHSGFDTAVAITTRGWESMQAGVCFGAGLAIAASGCISDDEDSYIGHDVAMRWAKKSLAEADKHAKLAKEQEAARAQAQGSGNMEAGLETALSGLAGAEVKQLLFMLNQLGIVLKDGRRVSGSAWRVVAKDGTAHAQNRYSTIRTRQARLMGGPGGAKIEKELGALEKQLEQAESLDEQGSSGAQKEIKAWPDAIRIQSAAWVRPNVITVVFDTGTSIEFAGGMFGETTCVFPPLRYDVSDEGPRLS